MLFAESRLGNTSSEELQYQITSNKIFVTALLSTPDLYWFAEIEAFFPQNYSSIQLLTVDAVGVESDIRFKFMKIRGEMSLYPLFANLLNGHEKLSKVRWASLLGIAGLLLVVRSSRARIFCSLSSRDKDSSDELLFVPGLRNVGNNCFFNVILQALASCSSFYYFLKANVEELNDEQIEGIPLTVALASLCEELCAPQERSKILNPQKVMSRLKLYIPQFKLTNQQDAAEAFLHLLSSFRVELSELIGCSHGSLADVATPSGRFVTVNTDNEVSILEKWRRRFIGPFDGVLGSSLTCQSCNSEIIVDFELFHTLPLLPVADAFLSIADGCTLEDCLTKFTAPEQVENYHCNHCWHLAAVKYLSGLEGNEDNIKRLSCCSEEDSCDCQYMSSLQGLPWSDQFSRTVKQVGIACTPKILCLQIQRVSMNIFGDLIKLQGHVAFPLILNVSPFIYSGFGRKDKRDKASVSRFVMGSCNQQMSSLIPKIAREGMDDVKSLGDPGSELGANRMFVPSNNEVGGTGRPYMYRLVSVVEHFGGSGGGHYIVYRAFKVGRQREPYPDDDDASMEKNDGMCLQWFCISDTEVQPITETEVLSANAALLFYEKIG